MLLLKRARLRRFIARQHHTLLATLRLYARRSGLAHGDNADALAQEILSEVVVAALRNADRFDTARHPMSWLLGIGANMLRRRQTDAAKRDRREPLVRDLYHDDEAAFSDDDLFDRLALFAAQPDDHEVLDAWLAPLAADDRHVIELAILYDLDGEELSHALGVNPGAARMRLHRALRRLQMIGAPHVHNSQP